MKRLTTTLCLTIAVLLGSVGESFALPQCEGSPKEVTSQEDYAEWDNCEGKITFFGASFSGNAGDKYVGEFKDGTPNGQGAYTFADGIKYVGEFKDEIPNGQGTYTFADGDKYVGAVKDWMPNGQGTYTFADGDKYAGAVKDWRPNGQGTYTYADGRVEKGTWKDGEFVGN